MDIKIIASYLAGKLSPYYWDSNLRKFTKVLQKLFPKEYTKDEIIFSQKLVNNDDEKFYFNILDDLYQEDENIFYEVVQELGIPDDVLEQAWVNNINNVYNLNKNKNEKNYKQKLIEYIINNIPRLYFMDKLNKCFDISFEKISFWWKQANQNEEEFYDLVLDYLFSKFKKDGYYKIKVNKFFQELDIPKELYIEITEEDIQKLVDYLTNKDVKIKDFINTIKKCWIWNKDLSNYMFDFKSKKIYRRLLKEFDKQEIIKIMEYFKR